MARFNGGRPAGRDGGALERPTDVVRRLGERHQGAIGRFELRAEGVSRSAVQHLLADGVLWVAGSRVVVAAGSPSSHLQDLAIVQLDAGPDAAISHEAGAAVMAVPGYFFGPTDVSRPRRAQRGMKFLGELHEPCWLPEEHIVVVDGIRVTKMARLLYDLAGTVTEGRFLRTFANTVSRHPSLLRDLHAMMPLMGRRGRPGIALMRSVLDEHPVGSVVEESGLEGRVIAILAEAGIAVRKQVNVGNHDHWIGRTDMKLVDDPVVIEVDSDLHHTSTLDRGSDERRDADMVEAGFVVVRIREDQVWHRPWEVVTAVLRARRESRDRTAEPGSTRAAG